MTSQSVTGQLSPAAPNGVSLHGWPGWPYYDAEQIAAVTEVLRSGRVNYWTGDICRKFETEYAHSLGVPHAIAVANGTNAIELALEAFDIGPGDEVIVPCRTFLATASSVVTRGARPVFADVDPLSQNVSAATIAPLITARTRAVIVVHLAGWPCDMDPILDLARAKGIRVIEDCAQAHGAFDKGRPVGSMGDAGCFSFCQDKIITTGGEGGLVTFHDERVWKKAWSYKDHGKGWDTVYNTSHPGIFRWLHDSIGTNWRLTEMQAAIGRIQLAQLPEWIKIRRQHAARLTHALSDCELVTIPTPPPTQQHSYYKFYAFIRPERLAQDWSRDRIVREIQARGVPCGVGSCSEIYLERAFQSLGLAPETPCLVSRDLGDRSLMFVVHPTLREEHLTQMGQIIRQTLKAATSNQERHAA
ncbi:MAG: DegT/DnrJ/EryC1/StrS aminotransferase family protein [Planctomycetaceae bacterium]